VFDMVKENERMFEPDWKKRFKTTIEVRE
jgi:hypothetical protein